MKAFAIAALALTAAAPVAAEKKVQMKDLPAAVQQAVHEREAKGANVKNISVEKSGKRLEVVVDGNGKRIKH